MASVIELTRQPIGFSDYTDSHGNTRRVTYSIPDAESRDSMELAAERLARILSHSPQTQRKSLSTKKGGSR